MVKDFTAYADLCFREFGDRVSHWTTINEPNVFAIGGYDTGMVPPKRCSPTSVFNCSKGNSSSEPYLAAHHMLLAHAWTARLYRERYQGKQLGLIGISIFAYWLIPLTNSTEDAVATQRAQDFLTGWIADPLVFGDYPSTMKRIVGSRLPAFTNQESKLVKGSFDFMGLIHYEAIYIKDNPSSLQLENRDFNADMAIVISTKHPDNSSGYEAKGPCGTHLWKTLGG